MKRDSEDLFLTKLASDTVKKVDCIQYISNQGPIIH